MKIYTKTGDTGATGLLGGTRVEKSAPRIELTGQVDEVNASIGWAAVGAEASIARGLEQIQHELFAAGAHLSADGRTETAGLPAFTAASAERLEAEIDAAERVLAPLAEFILPGGSETAARLHLARTVCRRAERRLVALREAPDAHGTLLVYLNRLSDWLFVQARLANHLAGVGDMRWVKGR